MKYKYVAKSFTGVTTKGVVDAPSQQAAVEVLREQKLVPVKVSPLGVGLH